MYEPEFFEACPVEMTWSDDLGLCFQQFGELQPLMKLVLLDRVNEFTFKSLATIAEILGLKKAAKSSRKNLLEFLAGLQGNEFYVQDVLDRDEKSSKSKKVSEASTDFVNLLMDNIDLDDRKDFKDLQEDYETSEKNKRRKQWNEWLSEKQQEMKAGSGFGQRCSLMSL